MLLLACVFGFGCVNLEGFRTEAGAPFRGEIKGVDALGCDDEPCSFVRRGFQAGTELALEFDPDLTSSVAGTLTTSGGECDPVFNATELRAIAPLVHDPLSQFDFPGGDRLRNYMLIARPSTGPLAGRDVTVFLSLMSGDVVEVRIVAGDGSRVCDPSDCGARTDCDFFGVFKLGRPDS